MAIPEMTPIQKYEQFVKLHPQYKNCGFDKVCSIMLKDKFITEKDLQVLKASVFSGSMLQIQNNNLFDGYGNMNLHLSSSTKPVKNYVEKPRIYHQRLEDLELNKGGGVDLNQFTMSSLKEKYDSKEYNVAKDKNGKISVTKKNGELVFEFVNRGEFGSIATYYTKSNVVLSAQISKTGELFQYSVKNLKNDGSSVTTFYGIPDKYPSGKNEVYPDGSRKNINFDKKTGKITFQDFWLKGANTAKECVDYTNGKPYKKTVDGKVEYPLVNDLVADITAKNKLGLPTTRESIKENVLNRITYQNVEEILVKYKETTGRELIQDIKDEIGLSSTTKNKLINHIETLHVKQASAAEAGKYLAKQLYDDIKGLGSGNLVQHVGMISKKNIKHVLVNYRNLTFNDNRMMMFDSVDVLMKLEEFLPIHIGDSQKIADTLAPMEGLLTAINNETGLKQSERDKLIKQIVDAALEIPNDVEKQRIKRDISTHEKDNDKVEVDLYRATNTIGGDLRNPALKEQKVQTLKNQTFNGKVEQGQTGDCWLLAGLNSIIAKPEMLKVLESKVKIDSKTGDYIVYLSADVGAKPYRVTKQDFNEYPNLSNGSLKVNAIEIAVDKHIRDEAYKKASNRPTYSIDEKFDYAMTVDINCNISKYLWNLLFGINPDNWDIKVNSQTEDFNNPNRAYSMSIGLEDDISGLATSEKDANYSIVSRHAYSIIGSDDKNIYMLNPWDSSDKITITRENFQQLIAHIEAYEIPKK